MKNIYFTHIFVLIKLKQKSSLELLTLCTKDMILFELCPSVTAAFTFTVGQNTLDHRYKTSKSPGNNYSGGGLRW